MQPPNEPSPFLRHAGIRKPASCYMFRHSFATHVLQDGCDIRTVQEQVGHKARSTTVRHACHRIVRATARQAVRPRFSQALNELGAEA